MNDSNKKAAQDIINIATKSGYSRIELSLRAHQGKITDIVYNINKRIRYVKNNKELDKVAGNMQE